MDGGEAVQKTRGSKRWDLGVCEVGSGHERRGPRLQEGIVGCIKD